jgi:hypothetical protein
MSTRLNPFANLETPLPSFTTKPKPEKPIAEEAITRIAAENNFPSRQATRPPKEPKRKPRTYRTGRNRQFKVKLKPETVERFYQMADARKVPLGVLMEQALDALAIRPPSCRVPC